MSASPACQRLPNCDLFSNKSVTCGQLSSGVPRFTVILATKRTVISGGRKDGKLPDWIALRPVAAGIIPPEVIR